MALPLVASGGWNSLGATTTWDGLSTDITWDNWTTAPPGLALSLAGVFRQVESKSLRIRDTVDDHSELSALVYDRAGFEVNPRRGMPITLYQGEAVVFDGWVDDVTSQLTSGGSYVLHALRASDHSYLVEKRVIAGVWEDTTAGDVVRAIVDTVLTEEGITYTSGSVDDGPPVRRWASIYRQCSEIIDELADQANFVWYVDVDRVLHFHARDRFDAPWTVTDDDALFHGASTQRGNNQYRNQQWMVGGKDSTQPITEEFVGDGERRTFNVGFPVRRQPAIKVNGATQTVGVRGIDEDSNKDWLFAHSSTELLQNSNATKLTASDLLEVTYEGVFEFVSRQDDEAAITERSDVEGGTTSGLVEKVAADAGITSRIEAFERGARKLAKYGRPSRLLTFETLRSGLKAGQIAEVDLPQLALSGEMLVTQVQVDDLGAGNLRWRATLVDGPHEDSWRKLFRTLARPQTDQVLENVSEDDTVTILKQYSKDWEWAENPNMLRRLVADGSVRADGTYTATFRDQDRISYLEWTNLAGTAVLGRSQLIDRQGLDTHEVFTTAYLSAAQGSDGGVGELRWYGGHEATLAQGTGVLVATVTVNEEKSEAEAWMIERTDAKDDDWDDDRDAALGS